MIRFTVCQTCLTKLTRFFFDKMHSKAHCLYPLLPQSEVNLNIYAVGGMTLFYPHVPKIFTRDLSSCVVCLISCNNSILSYRLILFYRTIHSFWVCEFYYISAYFYMLVAYVLSHMRLSCVYKY